MIAPVLRREAALSASSSDMRLSTRTERAAAAIAPAPRLSSAVISAPLFLRVWWTHSIAQFADPAMRPRVFAASIAGLSFSGTR